MLRGSAVAIAIDKLRSVRSILSTAPSNSVPVVKEGNSKLILKWCIYSESDNSSGEIRVELLERRSIPAAAISTTYLYLKIRRKYQTN
jgi:hypothetical protein